MLQIIHSTMYQIKTNFISVVLSYARYFQELTIHWKEQGEEEQKSINVYPLNVLF